MLAVPDVVRNKAIAVDASAWLDELPDLVDDLATTWALGLGAVREDATEAFVALVTRADGTDAVLKVVVPRDRDVVGHEITALALAGPGSCAVLLDHDRERGALLLERLGTPMFELGLPLGDRLDVLTALAVRMWRPAPDCGLPTGAEYGRWLVEHITALWEELDRPCSEAVVDDAVACAERRIADHDDIARRRPFPNGRDQGVGRIIGTPCRQRQATPCVEVTSDDSPEEFEIRAGGR